MLNKNTPETKASQKKQSLLPCQAINITYQANNKTIIDNLSLELDGRSITIIMGPNGAGKSILLRLLHSMLPLTSGSILWNGEAVSENTRKKQAMVFQKPVLLRRSVSENIDFAMKLMKNKHAPNRDEILQRVGLLHQSDQQATSLSGGEQQRLVLARALMLSPEVLFLDEPTANLDPASTKLIEEIIKQESHKGTKIVFVTHDIAQAKRLGDEIFFMHKGKITEHSNAQNFFINPESQEAKSYLNGELIL